MSLVLALVLIGTALVLGVFVGVALGGRQLRPELDELRTAAQESQRAKADALREISEFQKSREVIKRDFEKAQGALQEAQQRAEELERAFDVERSAAKKRDEELKLALQQLETREADTEALQKKLAAAEDGLKQLAEAKKGAASAANLKKQLDVAKKMSEQGQKQRQELQAKLAELEGAAGDTEALEQAKETIAKLEGELEEARASGGRPASLLDAIDSDPDLNAGQRETVRMIVGRFLGKRDE